MGCPKLSLAAIECAARMKTIFDESNETLIWKGAVDEFSEAVFAELERAGIILSFDDSSVIFRPEGYRSILGPR